MTLDHYCPLCQGTGMMQSATYDGLPLIPCRCTLDDEMAQLRTELAELRALELNHEGACVRLKEERDKARLEREQLRVWKSIMMQSVASFVRWETAEPANQIWWRDAVRRADDEMAKVMSLEDCVTVQLNTAGEEDLDE